MRKLLLYALLLFLVSGVAHASGPAGIYAVVDRVVFEPSESNPERIQLWGVFSLATKEAKDSDTQKGYAKPVRGVLRFGLLKNHEALCRTEWNDLKKLAGTDQCVAFGATYFPTGDVPPVVDLKREPLSYPINNGLHKIDAGMAVSRLLRAVPDPTAPEYGAVVAPGTVTLQARNALGKEFAKARYLFEITSASGQKETSDPIEAGDKTTSWKPKLQLKEDQQYTWTVRVAADDYKHSVASGTFKVKAQP